MLYFIYSFKRLIKYFNDQSRLIADKIAGSKKMLF